MEIVQTVAFERSEHWKVVSVSGPSCMYVYTQEQRAVYMHDMAEKAAATRAHCRMMHFVRVTAGARVTLTTSSSLVTLLQALCQHSSLCITSRGKNCKSHGHG